MKPIKQPAQKLTDETKAKINGAMTEAARRWFKNGYNDGWRRGFRIGVVVAGAAVSLFCAAVLVVVLVAR